MNSIEIAKRNDRFRALTANFTLTRGIIGLGDLIHEIAKRVRDYDKFNEDNDPYGEHDFGSFEISGNSIFWKIDYYDQDLRGWCDPLDDRCRRVLTVLLAEEY